MSIEFVGSGASFDSAASHDRGGAGFDRAFTLRLARAHAEHGWDRVLVPYASGYPDPAQVAAFIACNVGELELLVAHRPNVSAPTFAAKTFATLDHVSDGRVTVHLISGGSDADQAREGDHVGKDARYARTREYMRILKRAWTSAEPFDHVGEHYAIKGFASDVLPLQRPWPQLSFGGSSDAAYAVGGAEADVYALYGEPLAGAEEQIGRVRAAALAAGRAVAPRIHMTIRVVLGATERDADERARRVLALPCTPSRPRDGVPRNVGSRRLRAFAERGARFDRALWATPASYGAVMALVGTPDTVTAALMDYHALGVEIFSLSGFDGLDDVALLGRELLPLVRSEVARREAVAA